MKSPRSRYCLSSDGVMKKQKNHSGSPLTKPSCPDLRCATGFVGTTYAAVSFRSIRVCYTESVLNRIVNKIVYDPIPPLSSSCITKRSFRGAETDTHLIRYVTESGVPRESVAQCEKLDFLAGKFFFFLFLNDFITFFLMK